MKHTDAIEDNTRARNDLADTLRPIDYAGHVPAEPVADEKQDEAAPLCPYDRDQPDLRCAWMEGYLAAVGIVAAHGQAQLERILDRRPA